MKAGRFCVVGVAALSLMACGDGDSSSGTELTASLSGAAERVHVVTAPLTGGAEQPNPVSTTGSGNATIQLEGKKLKVAGSFRDLTANATAAHIHGPADESSFAPVFCSLLVPAATSGSILGGAGAGSCGDIVLSDADVANFEGRKMYVNIHTSTNANGEIRGQLRLEAASSGTGEAKVSLDGKRLKVSGSFTGLSSDASSAHIHGPAEATGTAGVFCTLQVPAATSGDIQAGQGADSCGDIVLSDADVANFEGGKMYINIHTQNRPDGEIRGQLGVKP